MNPIQKEKIQVALDAMGDTYWEKMVDVIGVEHNRFTELIKGYSDKVAKLYTEYTVTSVGVLEAKYHGYRNLLDAKSVEDEVCVRQQTAEEIKQLKAKQNECYIEIQKQFEVFIREVYSNNIVFDEANK